MKFLALIGPRIGAVAARHPDACSRTGPFFGPRALLGSVLLAAALAVAVPAPQTQAQEAPVAQAQRVNINTADAAALSSALSGIGQARAEAIVRYREMYGPFESIEELMEVSGVGEATVARNRELIALE